MTTPVPLGRLDHVHLRVPDRAAAVTWYGEHLGFAPVERFSFWAEEVDGGPIQLSADGGQTMIALFEATESHPMVPNETGIAFSTDSESFVAFARSLPRGLLSRDGAPLQPDDILDFDLCWAYEFVDPWNNRFELNCYAYDAVAEHLVAADGLSPTRYWPNRPRSRP